VKDAFAKKFFGAGRDSAGGALARPAKFELVIKATIVACGTVATMGARRVQMGTSCCPAEPGTACQIEFWLVHVM
jgi:hypothetical protein